MLGDKKLVVEKGKLAQLISTQSLETEDEFLFVLPNSSEKRNVSPENVEISTNITQSVSKTRSTRSTSLQINEDVEHEKKELAISEL